MIFPYISAGRADLAKFEESFGDTISSAHCEYASDWDFSHAFAEALEAKLLQSSSKLQLKSVVPRSGDGDVEAKLVAPQSGDGDVEAMEM